MNKHRTKLPKISIDFDDTIIEEPADRNASYNNLKLLPNAREIINLLYEKYQIIIVSSRMNPDINPDYLNHIEWISWFMGDRGIRFDEITAFKPIVDYDIDNKNLEFDSWIKIKKLLEMELKI